MFALGKVHDVPNAVRLPFFKSDELELCMYLVIPHLDGWAEIAVLWLQDLPAFLFHMLLYFGHLFV